VRVSLVQLRGLVVRRRFAAGSKSEHDAVMLDTGGASYVLRTRGGRAFGDPALDPLVGRRIWCEGRLAGYALVMERWEVLGDPAP
jgi:hypothetical protein